MFDTCRTTLLTLTCGASVLFALGGSYAATEDENANRIRPYARNPRYWQYKGEPVLLLGGSKDDNLFQIPDLKEHLDLLAGVGGNYIRNTMSARIDKGFEVQAFKRLLDGKYDLDQWNDEYWNRFERMLKLTRDRNIIVQIEIWAFHDFNKGHWEKNPWRPANNTSYNSSNTTLKEFYGNIGKVPHDFFFTVPKLNNDGLVLAYQQKFVDKILSHSLRYGHVLYCMTNEIHPQFSPEWGWYWSEYIKDKAAAADRKVETTEMYWEIDLKKPQQRASLDRPDVFSFFEASQNSAKMGRQNWGNLQFTRHYLAGKPRPINHVKIYGADTSTWKGSTDRHASECFWRNIMGGSASSRFHRPPYGMGLSRKAQAHIKSLRMLTNEMNIFTCAPHNDLLSDRKPNEAYCLANPGKEYAVYFPDVGEVVLDIGLLKEPATIRWLEVSTSKWEKQQILKSAQSVILRPPDSGPWVALLLEGTALQYGNRQEDVRVIYDNDQTRDVYTDEVLMAMASAGRIQLVGMITTRTVNDIGYDKYDELVAERKQMVNLARKSGMRHLPEPVKGPRVSLQPPASGKIDDTMTIGTDGSRLIVREARKASPSNPLVVICGGQLTAVADAYLLDPSIEDKVVVAALLGHKDDMGGFNGLQDPWAAYIVLQRLTYVQIPERLATPHVPKKWLHKALPDTPLKQWMIAKIHPLFPDRLPGDFDYDGQPVLPLLTNDYVTEVKCVAFGDWKRVRFGNAFTRIPTFVAARQNGESRALVVVKANGKVGTQAWQAAMANPAAWRQANDSGTQSSGNVNATSTQVIQAPYPSSPVVRAMRLDWSTHKRFAQGSDNFQLTWADDNHLYGAWGDGGGFGGTNEDGRVSLGVARVEGSWKDYRGCNVWGGKYAENPAQFKGKSWGMICIDGVLYMWVVPDYSQNGTEKIWHYSEARLAKSTDHGTHWTRANWAFFESEKLIIPTICNFGKNYAGARGNYVYHYFICPQDNLPPCDRKRVAESLIVHKPGRIYLARVDENEIFDSRDNYQFFIGLDKNGLPKWGNISAKQPVFKDKNGAGWCMSASYNPGVGRYILCTEHTESSKGNLGIFDAPDPWGPWTTVEYIDGWGKDHIELNTFFWNFPTKWLSEDGREFTLVFTGAGRGLNNDSFNTVRGRFILKDVPGHPAVRNP